MIKRLLIFLLMTSPAWAQSYVNFGVATGTTSASATLNINAASGNLWVASTKSESSAVGTLTMSSTGVTCTWTKGTAVENGSGAYTSDVAWCVIASSGAATVTATWAGTSGTFTDIAVAEYSPGAGATWNATPLDQIISTTTASATAACTSGTTAATTNANDILVGVCFAWASAQTYGAASGYTQRANSSRNTTGWYDQSVSATGTQSISTTLSTADVWTGWVVALKRTLTSSSTRGKAVIF